MSKEEKLELEPLELESMEDQEELELEALDLEELVEEEPGLLEQVPAPAYGALGGLALQKGAEKAIDVAEGTAEDLAFRAMGGPGTKQGRNLLDQIANMGGIEGISEMEELGQTPITPRSIGRRALNEKLLSSSPKQAEKALIEGAQETEKLLSNVEGKKSLEELLGDYKAIAGAEDLDPSIPLQKQKINMLDKQADDFSGERTAKQLERGKKDLQGSVDYGTEGATARKQLNKAQAKAYKEAVEDMVKSEGGEDLLKEFRKLKKASGERGVIKDMLTEDLSSKLKQSAGKTSFETAKAGMAFGLPGVVAKKAVEGGAGMGAKALDVAAKIGKSKPVRGMLKSLPLLGAYLTYDEAKAAGASTPAALALTAADEVTDVVAAVPKLAAQVGMGTLGGDADSDVIENPKASREEKLKATINMQKKILENPETSEDNREFVKSRLSSLMKEYKNIRQEENKDKPLIQAIETPNAEQVDGVVNAINNSNVDTYKTFLPALNRAKEGTDRERAQAQFELQQQPAFRKMLEDLNLK